jgi:nucleotide-binding universal stress UspA family protein
MRYKDILVQIDAAATPARYQIAAGLAARASGDLTGLYLKTTLINQFTNIGSIGYLPPNELNRMIREHNEGQDADAAKSGAVLTGVAAAAGARCEWRVIDGDLPNDLIAETRRADLVILPPPSPSPAYNVHASPVDIALGGGGPVLIVPPETSALQIGDRPLVAWNGSREAARALRDCLPLLTDGAVVEVRVARPKDSLHDDAAPLRRHLERHGYRPNIVAVVDEGQSVAAWLNAEAVRTGCDLIVMGLYGHARLQEFVLGGVSRAMLHAPSLPLLISH